MATRGEPITTRFTADVTELKAGIQEANRQIKLANSAYKAASDGTKEWEKSTDGLQAKIEQLTSVQEAEQKKLELLKRQYAAVAEEQGENSAAAQNLLIRINNQQAAVNKTTANLRSYEQQLADATSASEDAGEATEDQKDAYEELQDVIEDQEKQLKDLKKQYANVALEQGDNSDAAKELSDQIEDLSSELADNKKKMKDAEDAADSFDETLDDLEESAEDTEGGFTVLKGAISTFAGNMMTAAAGAIKDLGSSILGLAEETREYRGEMNKLNSAAQDNGYSVDYAKQKYLDLYGILADETAANTTVSNFMAMGASTETLDSLLNSSMGIWAKYGDSIPLDGLAEAINETARVGTVTGGLADALNWAGISEDAFNEQLAACTTEQERQQLIASTLDETYGDLATSYQSNNASIIAANKANARYQDTLAKLGEKMEPVTTAITNGFATIMEKAVELADNIDMTAVADAIESGFSYFVDSVIPKIVEGFNWILDNKETIITAIQAVAAGFVAFKTVSAIGSVVSGFRSLFTVVKSGTGIMSALNAVMKANPIGLIATLIAGLVAAFVYLWNTSDEFREFWIGLWENIQSFCGTAIDAIVNFFTVTLPEAINSLISWFQQLPTKIGEFLTQAWTSVSTWASDMLSKATEVGTNFLNNVVTWFQQLPTKISEFVTSVITTVTTWATDMITKAQEVGSNFLSNIVDSISQLPGKISEFVSSVLTTVTTWVSDMIAKAKEAGSNFLTNVTDYISKLPGKLWTLFSQAVQKATQWGLSMVSTAKEKAASFVSSAVSAIQELPGKIWTHLSNTIDKVVSWGSSMVSKAKEAASNLVSGVIDTVSSLPSQMLEVGKNIVTGIWNGISDMGGWLWDQISGWAGGIVGNIKDFFGINSPSKLMADEVGSSLPEGVGLGIEQNEKSALVPVNSLAKKVRKQMQKVRSAMNLDEMKIPLLSDVSMLRSGTLGGIGNSTGATQQIKEITLNQYNTSPKALSRLDIYRQTKSLLFTAKRKVTYV